jgi:uncharacterized protein (TIGR02145 family)
MRKTLLALLILISGELYAQSPNKMDVHPKGSTIYGRGWYGNVPLSMGYVFVTDPEIKTLYGECITSIEKGENLGSFSIEGLPANKNLKVFIFSDNIPGNVGFEEFSLRNNEKRKVILDLDTKFDEPGFMADQIPDKAANAGAAGAILLAANLANELVTLLIQKSRSEFSHGTIEQLKELKTLSISQGSIINDNDGHRYKTVMIGNQIWMAENLKTTKFSDGTAIPLITDMSRWEALTTPGYCWYDNDITNKDIYGALYNWYVVGAKANGKNLCPMGWHVPSNIEWTTLITHLGGESVAGGKLKSTGTIERGDGLWRTPNKGATNQTEFSALPGGSRTMDGTYQEIGINGNWWSTTVPSYVWLMYLYYDRANVLRSPNGGKRAGLSVRCIKDN